MEGDWLEKWCGPRNPSWPPTWPPILVKMSIHVELAVTTCILFVFGLKMFIIEEKSSDYIRLCHKSLTEHHVFTIKARKVTKLCQILKNKQLVGCIFTWTVSQKWEYIATSSGLFRD